MTSLTIFTPTYNRINILKKGYEALKNQTNKDFMWLIVDDGSTDNTNEEVSKWISETSEFEIKYIYKTNGGLHTAYNTAIANIDTELCVCIDSDDFMPKNAVDLILKFWNKYGSNDYAGIVGLDFTLDDKVIGDYLSNLKTMNLIDMLLNKYHIKNGDKTIVVRTELYKKYAPMKVFNNEKNFNPHYMHLQMSKEFDFLVLNENLRYVDYQEGGMTDMIFYQYRNSPNSFAEIRKLYLSFSESSLAFKVKHMIHYISCCIFAKKYFKGIQEINNKLLFVCLYPFGFILNCYIKNKTKRTRK